MYTVWVIQTLNPSIAPCAYSLMGDYAVRLFTSLEKFELLIKFGSRRLPDFVLIDVETDTLTTENAAVMVRKSLGEIPLVLISELSMNEKHQSRINLPNCLSMTKPFNLIEFNRKISHFMALNPENTFKKLRYKDIFLDFENLTLNIAPSETREELPLKEAQLLRLFIEKAGVCMSRQHIKEMIWRGTATTHRNIDSYVSRLRRKLECSETEISSIYGSGYIFK